MVLCDLWNSWDRYTPILYSANRSPTFISSNYASDNYINRMCKHTDPLTPVSQTFPLSSCMINFIFLLYVDICWFTLIMLKPEAVTCMNK